MQSQTPPSSSTQDETLLDVSNKPRRSPTPADAPPTSVAPPELPKQSLWPLWLKPAVEYFSGLTGTAWLVLIHKFVIFEVGADSHQASVSFMLYGSGMAFFLTLKQKLGYLGRPKEVGEWIKTRNYSNIPKLNLKTFAAAWWKWWEGLQLAWRTVRTRTTPVDYVAADNWPKLRKGP